MSIGGDTHTGRAENHRVSQRGATCATRKDRKRATVSFNPAKQDANSSPSVSFRANRRGADSPPQPKGLSRVLFFLSSLHAIAVFTATVVHKMVVNKN